MARPQKDGEEDRHFTHGSGGANADMAVEATPMHEDRHIDAPHAREVEPLKEGEKHDHMAEREEACRDRQDALLDEAIEETFPGSDPISPKHIT